MQLSENPPASTADPSQCTPSLCWGKMQENKTAEKGRTHRGGSEDFVLFHSRNDLCCFLFFLFVFLPIFSVSCRSEISPLFSACDGLVPCRRPHCAKSASPAELSTWSCTARFTPSPRGRKNDRRPSFLSRLSFTTSFPVSVSATKHERTPSHAEPVGWLHHLLSISGRGWSTHDVSHFQSATSSFQAAAATRERGCFLGSCQRKEELEEATLRAKKPSCFSAKSRLSNSSLEVAKRMRKSSALSGSLTPPQSKQEKQEDASSRQEGHFKEEGPEDGACGTAYAPAPFWEDPSRTEPRRLLHFRLRVKNLEKMLRFYTDVLGMHVLGYAFTPAVQSEPECRASGCTPKQAESFRTTKEQEVPPEHSSVSTQNNRESQSSAPQNPSGLDGDQTFSRVGSAGPDKSTLRLDSTGFADFGSPAGETDTASRTPSSEDLSNRETVEELIARHRRETSLHPPHISIAKREGSKGATTAAALRRAAEEAENAGPRTVVLLGYPTAGDVPNLDTLKIELVYVPQVAELLERLDAGVQTEDETETKKFLHVLKQHMMGLSRDLPTINRAREFERRRNRHDRGFHGFLGVTVGLPSLDDITHEAVEARGGRLFQLPARRKIVPSMIPDEHARKDIWARCAYLLDPEGNGVELIEAGSDSSVGLDPAAVMQEHQNLRSWEAYMHDQERDVRIQEVKRQIILLRERIAKQENASNEKLLASRQAGANAQTSEVKAAASQTADTASAASEDETSSGGENKDFNRAIEETDKEGNIIAEGEADALRKALNIKPVDAPKTPQEQLEILEDALEAMQAQEAARPRQPCVQLPASRGPFLQKVRAYTSRILFADQFYCNQMRMKAVRYKSHLFERLYPWSRFAGVSKTFGCPAAFAAAARQAAGSSAAEQAAEAGVEELASMEKFAQGGDNVSVPAEWESESSTEPAEAARKVYVTEAAERQTPQLELIYAFDEDLIRIHPCFGYLAVGVDDVPRAVTTFQVNAPKRKPKKLRKNNDDDDDDEVDDGDAVETTQETTTAGCSAGAGGSCDRATSQSSTETECPASHQAEAIAAAFRGKLEAAGLSLDRAMVEDRDGYPILLMSMHHAQQYYADLHSSLRQHRAALMESTDQHE
ncbi:UNVERIFIED_CONTAM: glyoxalase family protein [Hammondia hammondi]|eukprot:XP_008887866.1 glyoxalase family protein [Hammondia hammondi]